MSYVSFQKKSRLLKSSAVSFKVRLVFLGSIIGGVAFFYSSMTALVWIEPLQKKLLEAVGAGATWCFYGERAIKTWFVRTLSWDLAQENRRLSLEKNHLLAQTVQLESLRKENQLLREAANFISYAQDQHFVTASILTSPSKSWGRTFLIGAGSYDGLKKGQPVVSPYGVIGRVFQVSSHTARVMPLTHRDCRIPVKGAVSRVEAMLSGNGSSTPTLLYLLDNKPLEDAEYMITSTYDVAFPPGSPVGKVIRTERGGVAVRSFVPWDQLEFVQVVISPVFHQLPEG